jgi:uncharacterized protein YukE
MTQTYEEFRTSVEQNLEEIRRRLQAALQEVADKFNDCVANSPWKWLLGPLGGGAIELYVKHAAEALEAAFQRMWDEFAKFVSKVWDQVKRLAGDPPTLMQLEADYQKAAGRIRDESLVIDRILRDVASSWSGLAYNAFSGVAGEQKNAIAGIDGGLTAAAQACANGADQILHSWIDVAQALLDYVGDLVDAIEEGTDAGKVITLDVGPAVKVLGDIVVRILKLVTTLETYMSDNATINTDMWRKLNNGLPGLNANNDWPTLANMDTSKMKDRGSWTPA